MYSRNSALDCCGGDVYDTNQQVCCTRSSAIKFTIDKDRVDDTDCCMPAKVPYNRHTHNCTQSGVLEKPETRDATILACPYCRRKAQPSSYCRARNGKRLPKQSGPLYKATLYNCKFLYNLDTKLPLCSFILQH